MNNEIIESIEDEYIHREEDRFLYIGVKVKTNKREILLLVYGEQCCCENFGRGIVLPSGIASIENMKGAVVQKIYNGTDWSWTKNNPDAEEPIEGEYQDDENGSVTLHIDTDRGQLKVYAYKYHNGYYAHDYSLTYNGKTQEGEI